MLSNYMDNLFAAGAKSWYKDSTRRMVKFSHCAIFKISYLMSFKCLSRAGHCKAAITNQCGEQVLVIHCVTIEKGEKDEPLTSS